ncbi:MAG: hypothetical protein OXC99_11460 [Chloroflexi bacterium]|nr:hypothetical protein [Chloroflexota bacterium]
MRRYLFSLVLGFLGLVVVGLSFLLPLSQGFLEGLRVFGILFVVGQLWSLMKRYIEAGEEEDMEATRPAFPLGTGAHEWKRLEPGPGQVCVQCFMSTSADARVLAEPCTGVTVP